MVYLHPTLHQTISDVGLIGSRLVKNVTRFLWPQACSPEPGHRHPGDIFYKIDAPIKQVWLVYPRVLDHEEGRHARVTWGMADAT